MEKSEALPFRQMNESDYIRKYRQQLEEFSKAGPISDWTDGHFVKLSEEISATTHILISKNTLKRLFGKIRVPDDYKPQRETKNALARYLSYKNWDDFCIKNKPEGEEYIPAEASVIQSKRKLNRTPVYLLVLVLSGFLAGWWFWPEKKEPQPEKFTFSIKNPVDTVPYTLVVNFDVSQLPTDSANLNLDGRIYLIKERHTITTNVVLPTYRWITLRNGNKILKSLPIHCLSRGWQCYFGKDENKYRLKPDEMAGDGKCGIHPSFFINHPETDSGNHNLDLRNTKNFAVDGDNFKIEIQLFTSPKIVGNPGTTFRIFGEHGHHEVRLYPKGGRQHNFIVAGEKVFLGRYEDLTQIPFEKGQWNKVVLEVKNRNFQLLTNEKPAFRESYKTPLGLVKGIFIQTEGHSLIESIKVWDEKGRLVENEEF